MRRKSTVAECVIPKHKAVNVNGIPPWLLEPEPHGIDSLSPSVDIGRRNQKVRMPSRGVVIWRAALHGPLDRAAK